VAGAVRALLAVWVLAAPCAGLSPAGRAHAQARDTTSAGVPASLTEARELIKNGDYDRAIDVLRAAIAHSQDRPALLGDAYLLLIKTYVFLGNDFKFKPQGRTASNLNYGEARDLIAEALMIPALRHIRPEPATDYPPEMIGFFEETRGRLFGGFRVVELEPAGAVVLLDADTLRAMGDALLGASDVPVGPHSVMVRAPGYKDLSETVTISPRGRLERSYRLERKRGPWWYAGRVAGAAGILGGAIALVAGRGSSSGDTPLPGAPPPPSR
jgi:hypothetical protein